MNKTLLALGVLAASVLLVPDVADAQRGGRGGGGAGMGGGRVGMGGGNFRGGAIAARPGRGDFRQAAINNPGRFGNRGDWRGRYPNYGGRYPNYGRYYGRYPYYGNYYGGWGWGLATGAVVGAAATYPYYNYPYNTYQTPISSTAGGYCATSVRTCALTNAAPVGTGCSCRTSGGRARGSVVAGY